MVKFRRFWAGIMSIVMIVGLIPTSITATEGTGTSIEVSDVVLEESNYLESDETYSLQASESYLWPAASKIITSAYGYRSFNDSMHYGIDISKNSSDPYVYATKSGTVSYIANNCSHVSQYPHSGSCSDCGNYIVIKHSDGTYAHYYHLKQNSLNVSVGDKVAQGDKIAEIGSSGSSTGYHLHFAVGSSAFSKYINVNPSNSTAMGITFTASNAVPNDSSGIYYVTNTSESTLEKTSTPQISSSGYVGGKKITLSADSGATIYYTTNGTTPTTSSTKYTSAFTITASGSTTIQAIAVRSGYSNSDVKKSTISITKMSTPTISTTYASSGMIVTLSADSDATIYYTLDGTTPTTSSGTKYSGGFTITSGATVKAIATASGAATSSTLSKTVSVQAPDTPSISLFDTDSKVAVGSAIQVVWDKQDIASTYETSLYLNDILVETQTTSETLASFLLTEVGEYTVTVRAINFVGSSADSYPPVAVEAMAPLFVTFEDWDGTVLSEVEVEYGEIPVFPDAPTRTGYNFNGWTTASNTALYADTVITATYRVQTYSVVFYDVDGTTVLETNSRVAYGTTLTPPTTYSLSTGYAFAGWHITPESAGTSFEPVDGQLTVIATQAWENMDLPVVAEVIETYRTQDGDSYVSEVKLTNWDQEITKGRLVSALKTSEDKLLTSDISAIELAVSETKNITVTLNYTGLATEFSTMVVGFTDDGDTGGAYSQVAISTEITADTAWSEPTEWSTEVPTLTADQKMETMTQTRSKELQTTTSSSSSLSGWTLYGTDSTEGSWSSWSTTKPSDKDGREIESEYVDKTYKTQYNYYGYKGTNGYYHFCAAAGKYIYGCTYSYIETGWRDSTLTSYSMTSQSCSGSLNGCTHDGKLTISTYYGSSPRYYFKETQKVQTGGGYYLYRYKDTSYTYYFYKYGEWTDWEDSDIVTYETASVTSVSDNPIRISEIRAASVPVATVVEETQTLYRVYTEIDLNDPNAGTEDTSGEVYTTVGNLELDADFEGNAATILVYQRTNSDPTAEVLQYVGQTTIGENNSYDFTFKPKGEPTAKTGDFVVSLALEGSTRIINVDVIDAPKTTYTVTFMADGEVLSTEIVEENGIASVPAIPEKEGYTFVGWDTYTHAINANLTINAVFMQKDCVVVVADFANESITMATQSYGNTVGVLSTPTAIGKTFIGWYTIENGLKVTVDEETVIKENTIIYADWNTQTYTVTFVDNAGTTISEQNVTYGASAQLPVTNPSEVDMEFAGWSTDMSWWYVTDNVIVYPIFKYTETAESPIVDHTVDNVLILASSTPDTTIFYSIESAEQSSGIYSIASEDNTSYPEGLTNVYEDGQEIVISEDVQITMLAMSGDKNISEVIVVDVPHVDNEGMSYGGEYPVIYGDNVESSAGEKFEIKLYLTDTSEIASTSVKFEYDSTIFGTLEYPYLSVNEGVESGLYEIKVSATCYDSDGATVQVEGSSFYVEVKDASQGNAVNGIVKSYNPGSVTTITLSQGDVVKYTTTIEATTGSGQVEQAFAFASVSTGTYDLLVSKDGHTDYSIINLIVGSDAVDLTANSNSAISLITLLCGDINGDNAINQTDLNVLWLPAIYNKTVETGGTDAALCDLNGDGSINQTDLNILWLPVNYNKSSITVNWEA